MRKKILLGAIALFLLAQLFQPFRNRGQAFASTDVTHAVSVPPSTLLLLKTACYDCHSDHTRYPWYSRITPVNWWLADHVAEGKRQLNFTRFEQGSFGLQMKQLDEIAETVEKGTMPLDSYTWMHGDARLSEEQRREIVNWATAARAQVRSDSLNAVHAADR